MSAVARAPLQIIVAATARGVIGKDGALPWRLPEDLRHFKATTLGHAVVMGRATFASIGKALPGRRNIVLSRREGAEFPGCETARSFEEAIARARETDAAPFVIGGAEVYRAALPVATSVHLTRVAADVDGDAFFPALDPDTWHEVSARAGDGCVFTVLERRPG